MVTVSTLRSSVPLGLVFLLVGPVLWAQGDLLVPDQYGEIQSAINDAIPGDTILVRAGTYSETIDFLGKAITVESEVGPNDTTIDAVGSGTVVTCASGEGRETVLRGFTITGGNADRGPISPNSCDGVFAPVSGGGMLCEGSSPTVINCFFVENTVTGGPGGGVACINGSNPEITDCCFVGNTASGFSGGMICHIDSNPVITNCMFSNNSSTVGGGFGGNVGALGLTNSSPLIINCTFSENTAEGLGGALGFNCSNPTILNCTFDGNESNAGGGGGGLFFTQSLPTITNCRFTDNVAAGPGGAIRAFVSGFTVTNSTFVGNAASVGGAIFTDSPGSPVENCIVWGNAPDQISGEVQVRYSDVENGFPGVGNIDADPLFVSAGSGDFRLQPGSPCIDAGGNPAVPPDTADLNGDGDSGEPTPVDLAGQSRFVDDPNTTDTGVGPPPIVDMGAYEYYQFIRGDSDGDGVINGLSDSLFVLGFVFIPGSAEPPCRDAADVNDDGTIGLPDGLNLLNFQFVPGSPPPPPPFPNCGIDPTPDSLGCGTGC